MAADPTYDEVAQNPEAEAATLGSLLISPDAWKNATVGLLLEWHFAIPQHRTIWQSMQGVRERGGVPDIITLTDDLARRGKLDEVGGASYVSSLANAVPTSRNVGQYALIVLQCATRRAPLAAFTDLAQAALHGTMEDYHGAYILFRDLMDEAFNHTGLGMRYHLQPVLDMPWPPTVGYLLGDILPRDAVGILYATAGRWKTFLAMAWACCVATGRPWFGRQVFDGPQDVLYIAAEGELGLKKRAHAWALTYGADAEDELRAHLIGLGEAVELLKPECERDLIGAIHQRDMTPALIFIDTLSASISGAGSDSQDHVAAAAINASYRLKAAFPGSTVLILHHGGKDAERGMRGSSALLDNVDFTMTIEATKVDEKGNTVPLAFNEHLEAGKVVSLLCEKPYRDGAAFAPVLFTTRPVSWEIEGAPMGSLVIADPTGMSADAPDERARRPYVVLRGERGGR